MFRYPKPNQFIDIIGLLPAAFIHVVDIQKYKLFIDSKQKYQNN